VSFILQITGGMYKITRRTEAVVSWKADCTWQISVSSCWISRGVAG